MFKGEVTGVLWPACIEYNCLNIASSCVFPFLYSYKTILMAEKARVSDVGHQCTRFCGHLLMSQHAPGSVCKVTS